MPLLKIAVYPPPGALMPYLGVVVELDGTISAVPFDNAAEARAYVDELAAEFTKRANDSDL